MQPRFNNQPQFHFQAALTLKITECYYGKYDRIDAILAGHPELLDLIHRDIAEQLAALREKIDLVAINKKSKRSKKRNSASATA